MKVCLGIIAGITTFLLLHLLLGVIQAASGFNFILFGPFAFVAYLAFAYGSVMTSIKVFKAIKGIGQPSKS